jgi:hypothetical protein
MTDRTEARTIDSPAGGGRVGGVRNRHGRPVRAPSLTYTAVNGGYWLVSLTVMGTILGAWR